MMPSCIRVSSHVEIARQFEPAGDAGLTLRDLATDGFAGSAQRREELALSKAGTVYLCYSYLGHAAQRHRGKSPRFMAQPPLLPREPISFFRRHGDYSPVGQPVRNATSDR